MEVKKEFIKSKEAIEKNIQALETKMMESSEEGPGARDLVEQKFYSGSLQPIIQNYLPEGFTLTEQELKVVRQGVRNLSTGIRAAIPITCYGDSCPFKTNCPFFKIGKLPVGKNCPVEAILMDTFTKRYIDEYEVSADDMSEVSMMSMLAVVHILEMRALVILAKEMEEGKGNPTGLVKNVVGYNTDDQPIVQLQEHPANQQLERAWRWRRNLLESMVGTRKEKYKKDAALKERSGVSPSLTAADLKSKIDKLTVIDISSD
jgi:hypothetical protein